MTFAAIDFETATYDRNSACSVGIVTIDNSIIVDEYYTLIQPPDNYYYYNNTKIHGISAKDTKHAGVFSAYYNEIYQRLTGKKIIAHNENFDRSVLRNCISHYGLSPENLQLNDNWECTLQFYRRLGYFPNRLSDCCKRLKIPLQHHDALSDAKACALLYLNYLQNY